MTTVGMRCLALFAIAAMIAGCARGPVRDVAAVVEDYRRAERVPGVAVVAMRGDRVVIAHGFGTLGRDIATPMTADVVQPLYSVSKHMTAALILALVRDGRLNVDDAVGTHLPEWFADEPDLRIHHLLRQTSGLADFTVLPGAEALEADPDSSIGDFIELADAAPRRFAPGARYAYSNSNYTALALIAERAGGAPFADLQRARLFAPRGLALDECAAIRPAIARGNDDQGGAVALPPGLAGHAGNGGVCGSARELARWMRALAVDRGAGYAALAQSAPTAAGYTPPYGYGLSTLPVAGRPAVSHSGVDDGWTAYVAHLIEDDLTVAIVANRGWLFISDLAGPVLRTILDNRLPALTREPLTPAERAVLDGRYEDGLFDYRLQAGTDELRVQVSAFPEEIVLHKQRDGRFVSPDHPDTFALAIEAGRGQGAQSRVAFDWIEIRSFLVPVR